MVGLYIRKDITYLISGKIKNGKISVDASGEVESLYPYLQDEDADSIGDIFKNFIHESGYNDFYISLADSLFDGAVVFDYVEDQENAVVTALNTDSNKSYMSFPLEYTVGNTFHKITGFSISKKYIDLLNEAANRAGAVLMSLEAASVSYLRSVAKWEEVHFLLDVDKDKATITSYSPIGGIYTEFIPAIDSDNIKSVGGDVVKDIVAAHDFSAGDIYTYLNIDTPYTFLSYDDVLSKFAAFDNRVRKPQINDNIKDCFADLSDIDDSDIDDIILVGTILCALPAENVFCNIPDAMVIKSFNMLPADIQHSGKLFQVYLKSKKVVRFLCVALLVLLVAELFGTAFYSMVTVPDTLKEKYNVAKDDEPRIKASLDLLSTAQKENQNVVEGMDALVKRKPEGLGFTKIEFGKNKNYWFLLTGVAKDPMLFRDYIDILNRDDTFSNAAVKSIVSESNNKDYKRGTIQVAKGAVK